MPTTLVGLRHATTHGQNSLLVMIAKSTHIFDDMAVVTNKEERSAV